MPNGRKKPRKSVIVAAVSGGPDSVYLLRTLSPGKGTRIVLGHVNYRTRGIDSAKDQAFVENIGKTYGYETYIHVHDKESGVTGFMGASGTRGEFPAGFEKKARDIRYRFLKELSEKTGAEAIALAHTADDQVETILMRVFEGAGIGGLKGIPRETGGGIVRPILDVWKEDILACLKNRKIPYRIDRSNIDTRFERNWVRNVLLPLLVKRYGKAVKKRIFTLGERFRELDDYLEAEAGRWIGRNVKMSVGVGFRRKTFSALPALLRVKILQRICFDRLGVVPNERLLRAMDGNIADGGPSSSVNVGEGWKLANRYVMALFAPEKTSRGRSASPPILLATPGKYDIPVGPKGVGIEFVWEARGKLSPPQAKRFAAKGDAEVFDADGLTLPLTVRPLRAGDRIRPFGGSAGGNARDGEKKVKKILIDRKIPRDDRWGRPVVCDAEGAILWIPGVLRSSHAPVTPETRKTARLRIRPAK